MFWIDVLSIIYFLAPGYFANMSAVLAGRLFKKRHAVDGGVTLRGKPLFGQNKSWEGILLGMLVGLAVFFIQVGFTRYWWANEVSLLNYALAPVWLGILMPLGALLGDLVESSVKRQLGRKPGASFIPWDQIDHAIGALLLASIIFFPGWYLVAWGLVATLILHFITNYLAFWLKLRRTAL